jgi:hypothetical protein
MEVSWVDEGEEALNGVVLLVGGGETRHKDRE